ncbi:MAG: ADP-forming succinate--CoA ligase subunit beta [Nocardiopsaceae bacterium]|nr:ADP-forming succinate--CoA ligase subunit beta [Nocardiopsaceae bacterium]
MAARRRPHVDLFEYQARTLLAVHGVPVPPAALADNPEEARIAADLFGGPVVVKAQVRTGGRGKAGGVRLASTPDEAAGHAEAMLGGMTINGHRVRRVLVVPASEISAEYYLSFLLDRASRTFTAVASAEGGVEIEQLAADRPESIARARIDPRRGLTEATARKLAAAARFPDDVTDAVTGVMLRLWDAFAAEEALLVEVNPLAREPGGRVLALDAKVTIDGNARFRHADHRSLASRQDEEDPLERRARERQLNYVRLDGQVGVIGNGAGLVMSTLDVVADAGAARGGVRPANFLDIGGGASAEVMASGLEIILADPSVRSVLVNVFGGITACDAVADGIVAAFTLLEARGEPVDRPVVVRLDGNSAERGRRILTEASLPAVRLASTMDSAAAEAARLAATGA